MSKMMTIVLSLMVLSLSNILPAQDCPQLLGSVSTSAQALGVAFQGNYAYLADRSAGLLIFDVSDPAAPVQLADLATPVDAFDVAVSGAYAYVADIDAGLLVVDVSNPAAPVQTGAVLMIDSDFIYCVFVSGHYVYATGNTTLYIIDVANPAVPAVVGSLATSGYTHHCGMKDHYLYVANHDAGVLIVDVSNPASPVAAGSIPGFGSAQGIAVSGNLLFVVDYWDSTLSVFDISSPTSPRSSPWFPPTRRRPRLRSPEIWRCWPFKMCGRQAPFRFSTSPTPPPPSRREARIPVIPSTSLWRAPAPLWRTGTPA